MTFACPKCNRSVKLRSGSCKGCGLGLTLREVIRFYFGQISGKACVVCPKCGGSIHVTEAGCPKCGHSSSLRNAVESIAEPGKARAFDWARGASPETKRWVQRMYFLLSLSLLWWMLAILEDKFPGGWLSNSAIAAVFLTAGGMLGAVIIPKRIVRTVIQKASATTKLALVANYLSAGLALRMFTTTWQERALGLVGVLLATGLAGYLILLFLPIQEGVTTLLTEEKPTDRINPTAPQGRRARYE